MQEEMKRTIKQRKFLEGENLGQFFRAVGSSKHVSCSCMTSLDASFPV